MKTNTLYSAILTIVLGALLIIFKSFLLNIVMTVLGAGIIVWAIMDAINKKWTYFAVKTVVGIALIVLSWLITTVILYVLAGLILCYAVYQIYLLISSKNKKWELFVQPILLFLVAVLLLFKGFNWAFLVAGIVLIAQGIISLVYYLK